MTLSKMHETINHISDFVFLFGIVLFLHFNSVIYPSITAIYWYHFNNYTPFVNKCFNPIDQNPCVVFVML